MLRAVRLAATWLTLLLPLNGCTALSEMGLDELLKPYGHSETDQAATLLNDVDGHLARQQPLEALAVLRENQDQKMNEAVVTGRYIAALNMALRQATDAEESDDYLAGGKLYRGALDFYPEQPGLAQHVDLAQDEIKRRIDKCADSILDNGLEFYRRGDLHQAIEIWSKIHHFHPDHTASLKAIQTTRTQIRNLQEITREPAQTL